MNWLRLFIYIKTIKKSINILKLEIFEGYHGR